MDDIDREQQSQIEDLKKLAAMNKEHDDKQQANIDSLIRHSDSNKVVDTVQWIMILAIAVGVLLYTNFVFVAVLNNQAITLKMAVERCGK